MMYKIERGMKKPTNRGRKGVYNFKNMPFTKLKTGHNFLVSSGTLEECNRVRNSLCGYLRLHTNGTFSTTIANVRGTHELRVWKD